MKEKNNLAIVKYGLFWCGVLLYVLLIALGWRNEEPGKIQTIIVTFIGFILALMIIKYAKNIGVINSTKLWILVFLLKLTLISIILQYLWIPSFPYHRTQTGFDPIVFDYYGKLLAENNFNLSLVHYYLNYTGQVIYIGIIYWLFGVSTFYVGIFNCLFSLITFLAITSLLINSTGSKKYWQLMSLGMFFPELLYYDSIPSKEVISTCMIALSMLFIYNIFIRKKNKSIILLVLSLSILIVFRASMVLAVIIIGSIWIIKKYRNRLSSIILFGTIAIIILLFLMPIILKYTTGFDINITGYLNLSSKVVHVRSLTLKEKSLNLMFSTSNPIMFIIYTPIRTIFYLIAPFPRLSIELSDKMWLYDFTKVSVWIVLLCFPILIAVSFQKKCRKSPAWTYIAGL